ncbi:MAG: hypothetical protein JWP29_3170 [Rhodoferax sp.]|nr:hypothetical protein [Rhodoferax sp.]
MATLCRTLCSTLCRTVDRAHDGTLERIRQRLWRGLAAASLASLACLACMANLVFAAPPSVEVSTATELRATPTLDGKVITRLAQGARGERTGGQGGWVKLRVAEQEGWVRLTHTKDIGAGSPASAQATPASQASVSNPITGLVGMFSATSNKPTATTGTRGLTQEQLANAQPAPAEVRQLEKYAITGAQAEQFARSGKVASHSIEAYTGADK